MTVRIRSLAVVALLILSAGCGGLPDGLREQARALPEQVGHARAAVAERKQAYDVLAARDEFAFFRPYAREENWPQHFTAAERALAQAEDLLQRRVQPVLERNKEEDAGALQVAIGEVRSALEAARREARKPMQRREEIRAARENASALIGTARDEAARIESLATGVEPVADSMRRAYPRRAGAIDSLVAGVRAANECAQRALGNAQAEFTRHQQGSGADYAAFADGVALVGSTLGQLRTSAPEVEEVLLQLDRSYDRILADMRVDYYLQPAGVAWDNCCDYNTEHSLAYPAVKVDEATFEAVTQAVAANDGSLGTYSTGWGNDRWSRTAVEEGLLARIGLSNPRQGWQSGDDEAEFWIEDAFPRTYHRYLVVENGDTATTDWIEVDEEDFYDRVDDLGMTIASKPYGYFESEVNEEPSPPGLNYVGNARYGCWRQSPDGPCLDESQIAGNRGNTFWHWYGRYAFFSHLLGGPRSRYDYDDWYHWDRNYRRRRAYYGRNASRPTYGTWGSHTAGSGRFSQSTFARSGGLGARSSVRGAGPAARGRGPGGGGK